MAGNTPAWQAPWESWAREEGGAMFAERDQQKPERMGFFASIHLAVKIVAGSLRLLARFPKLVAPMAPVFVLMLAITVAIPFVETSQELVLLFVAILAAAVGLMISFGVTSQMLKQIHAGRDPSLGDALSSRDMRQMIPRILGLSAIWYGIVLVVVIIEMIISAILDRISDNLGDTVVNAIFGTIGDALRMAAFMMVGIMTFEDVGLRPAFRRLREVVKGRAVVACGGLMLTKLATSLLVLLLIGLSWALKRYAPDTLSLWLFLPVLALCWLLCIYLEQLFVTGLYLYTTAPESPVVRILLQDVIGHELPAPALPKGIPA
jgi:hypothetical protein